MSRGDLKPRYEESEKGLENMRLCTIFKAESNMSGIAFLETRYAHPFFAPNKSKPWGCYDPFSWYPKPNQPKHQTVLNVQIP
jgi:hypothetical protein